MHYVYILQSACGRHFYVGLTQNLPRRFASHNAGQSPHTAKFRPWRIRTYHAFDDRKRAEAFEKYLKSGSGRAFARKRF
jgi:putative endonuclease